MSVFVLGTGRSGTHWVGWILDSHPDIRATIEKKPLFWVATQAAVRPSRRPMLLAALRAMYMYERARAEPYLYADKSHPVIWYAERVAEWFSDAKFVVVERSVFGTVASMLRHEGVSAWQREWRRYGVPNRFLGVTRENADRYDSMSPAEQAALRWRSHQDRIEELHTALPNRLLVLRYESMVDDFYREVDRLWRFVSVESIHVRALEPKAASRGAWRQQLSAADVRRIAELAKVEVP